MDQDLLRSAIEAKKPDLRPVVSDAHPSPCGVCGRIFEPAIIDAETRRVIVQGHVQGDPRTCFPKGELTGSDRDARVRRSHRKGR